MKTASRNGMTLIEVIISLLLAAIACGGVATTVMWSLRTIGTARESSAAMQSAQQEIERMRNSNFSAINSHTFPADTAELAALRRALGAEVNGSVAVQSENIYMKRVSVQVSWQTNIARNMSVSLVTYITKDGIDQR